MTSPTVHVRGMREADLPRVEAIYGAHTGQAPPPHWKARMSELLAAPGATVALVAEAPEAADLPEGGLVGTVPAGYLVGEVRYWEFGSEPAGWILSLGVDPKHRGGGVGRALLTRVLAAFEASGVRRVRTMVRRDDVPLLRFFRGTGFAAGPYTELERELTGGPS